MYGAVTACRAVLGDAEAIARLPVLILVGAIVYHHSRADRSIWLDVRKLATALHG